MSEQYITVVIKFDNMTRLPEFYADMPLLNGVVTAVQFNDALKELEDKP